MDAATYARAEALLPGNREKWVHGEASDFRCCPASDAFRFRQTTERGERFICLDPDSGLRREVERLTTREPLDDVWNVSPDERWAVRVDEGNVWLLDRDLLTEMQVTYDGSVVTPYASRLDWYAVQRRIREERECPVVVWSPDSRFFAMERIDQSSVDKAHLLQLVEDMPRPRLISYRDALPGDAQLPQATVFVVALPSGEVRQVALDPFPVTMIQPMLFGHFWFSVRGSRLEALVQSREQRDLRLLSIDPLTAGTTVVAEQEAATVVDPAPLVWEERPPARVLSDGRGVWVSESDGWAHLWLVDGSSSTQITRGEWVVRELVSLDEDAGTLLFTASGRESTGGPLDRRLYRVSLDGGEPELLTPEPLDHAITATTSGRWLIDRQSSPLEPPTSVVREAASGRICSELARTNVVRLIAEGWRAPERVSVLAADGQTVLHGLLYLPQDFSEHQQWPLLDVVYPGPQTGVVPRTFDPSPEQLESFAALGIAVLVLDARGTPLRSKKFHDVGYGDLGFREAIADQAAAVTQLVDRYSWLDGTRVGVLGNSGGGHMAVRALMDHPETFSVAVSSVGNHDNRRYHAGWGERYLGLMDRDPAAWRGQSNVERAADVQGKLLLGISELDANVHPTASRALVAALVDADVDHEVVLLPNGDHRAAETNGYYVRKVWDFLCRHLIGTDPPTYKIAPDSFGSPDLP